MFKPVFKGDDFAPQASPFPCACVCMCQCWCDPFNKTEVWTMHGYVAYMGPLGGDNISH